jgi:hypothetical protein
MRGDTTFRRGKRGNTTTRQRIERQQHVNGGGSLAATAWRWQCGGGSLAAVAVAATTPTKLPPQAAAVASGNENTGCNSDGGGTDINQKLTKSGCSKGNRDGNNKSDEIDDEDKGNGGSGSSLATAWHWRWWQRGGSSSSVALAVAVAAAQR